VRSYDYGWKLRKERLEGQVIAQLNYRLAEKDKIINAKENIIATRDNSLDKRSDTIAAMNTTI
jgi:hypothetical protein